MRFGLTEAQLAEIIAILQKYPEVSRGLIFGSRAMGNYGVASDIDLAIKGKGVTFKTEISISGDLEDSELPFLCDVINYNSIDHPPFKEHIDTEGVIFYWRGWQEMCLGDFCQLVYGKALPDNSRDTAGKVPVYGSGGVVGYHSVAQVNSAGVIVGRKGTVGAVYLSEVPFWPIDTVFYLTNNDEWDLRFAYYLLKTLRLHEMNTDSAVPGLNRNNAHALKIKISGSNSERKSIAQILYDIDALINSNNNTSTILENMAEAIFKSWFVDFDPVHAKRLAREADLPAARAAMAVIAALCSPREFVENYAMMDKALSKKLASMNSTERDTLASTASLFPDSFADSELGKIPRGWKVQSLSSAMSFLNGLALQKFPPANDGTDLPVLKIAQLNRGTAEGSSFASNKIAEQYIVDDGDVIFSWSATLLVKIWTGGRVALNQHLFKVTSAKYDRWFQYFWCKHHLEKFTAIAKSKATTMGHIQRKHLDEAKIVIPDQNLINTTNIIMIPLTEAMISQNVTSKNLADLRDTLLPELINGDIDVS